MTIFAEIHNMTSKVVNLVIADDIANIPFVAGSHFVVAHANVAIGDTYNEELGEFDGVPPPEPEPEPEPTPEPEPAPEPEPEPTPEPAPAPAPIVSPVEFKLLFTSAERIAIKAARATDPVVDDFMDIVDDPRLTFVNLGLQSTIDAINYFVSIDLIQPERVEQILSGQLS